MKLLLTSAGLTNSSIVGALRELVGKPFEESSLAFVPTAANVEKEGKEWLIDDLYNCKKLKFKTLDIVDISAIPKALWLPRLEEADILLFGGGNTFHLSHWFKKSGLAELLPKMLEKKVYVGISAGSMVTTKDMRFSQSQKLYYEDMVVDPGEEGLGFVHFYIRPHLNSPHFPNVRKELIAELAREVPEPVYALDDDSAVKVVEGNITVISEGEWLKFN